MADNTLKITVDGVSYRIVQIIKSCDFEPYDHQNFAYISEKDGKMGVFSQTQEEMLVEFEYDNITYAGNGVYIVIRNNKMGLIHPAYTDEEIYYDLKTEIPCEYDFIHTLGSYRKTFILQKNELNGPTVCAYLSEARFLTKTYDHYQYFKEGYINLWDSCKEVLLDTCTAETITNDSEYFVFAIYQTAAGIVIEEIYRESNQHRLTFVREYFGNPIIIIKDKTKIIDFEGELYVTYKENECNYPLAKLFRIERPDGTSITFNNIGYEIEQ